MTNTTIPAYVTAPEDAGTQEPIWDQEAEQSVLGGILLDNRAFDSAAEFLREGSFWHAAHQTIWTALASLIMANKPADVVTVYAALRSAGLAEDCGGRAYLNQLAESVPSAANTRRYAEIVSERAAQRDVVAAADREIGRAHV